MSGSKELPLVSIVTPVYNGESYLAECIESVCAQTYSNWEYVIVDNRSTDRTREIAENYAGKDPRIRVHVNETFLPLMQNWNHALREQPIVRVHNLAVLAVLAYLAKCVIPVLVIGYQLGSSLFWISSQRTRRSC